MNRLRRILAVPVVLLLSAGSLLLASGSASADDGGAKAPSQAAMVKYAIEQTKLLFAGLDAKTTDFSPRNCRDGDGDTQGQDVRYLQVNWSTATTNITLGCSVDAGKALILDFGGAVAWEDPHECPGYFDRDKLLSYMPPPSNITSTATLDGKPISPKEIMTPVIEVSISKSYTSYISCSTGTVELTLYGESELLGHPGRLAVAYSGKKAYIPPLKKGAHVIVLDHSTGGTHDRTMTYRITVG